MECLTNRLVARVQAALTDDLRLPRYRGNPNELAGHCYVASETIFHILGGKETGWPPMFVRHEDQPHWYILNKSLDLIIDPTESQFNSPVPRDLARGKGFRTKGPSKRAIILMNRLGIG